MKLETAVYMALKRCDNWMDGAAIIRMDDEADGYEACPPVNAGAYEGDVIETIRELSDVTGPHEDVRWDTLTEADRQWCVGQVIAEIDLADSEHEWHGR